MSSKHDAALSEILKQHEGLGKELNFLNTVFGFLARNTNVFRAPDIENRIAGLTKKARRQAKAIAKAVAEEGKTDSSATTPSTSSTSSSSKQVPSVPSVPGESVNDPPKIEIIDDEEEGVEQEEARNEEGGEAEQPEVPPPVGNGGTTDKYTWIQTLKELQVMIPVPIGTRGRDMKVVYSSDHLYVGLKNQPPIIDGAFPEKADIREATWTIESDSEKGRIVTVFLHKQDHMNWWNCVVKGDPEIDTKTIRPENSKIDDLDDETQKTVRKMMFDQRQKMSGKKSSDELKKQQMLEKFMSAHPEMDFSNAKIS